MKKAKEEKVLSGFGNFLGSLLEESGAKSMTPGEFIRYNRTHRFEMSIKDLAYVTGIKGPNISNLEAGKAPVTAYYAEIFGVAFGLPPSAILYPNGKVVMTKVLRDIERRALKLTADAHPEVKPKRIRRDSQKPRRAKAG